MAKHVEADEATRQARADAEYGSRTFVVDAAAITGIVDANAHDFVEALNIASARFDFNASIPVHVYMKTPPDIGAGHSSVKTIDGVATTCEIGVSKNGADAIKVTHFKML